MITVGSRWSLDWPKYAHLLDATVVALEQEHVVCDVAHRCGIGCPLQAMRATLPLHGRHKIEYRDFAAYYVPLAEDAIALGSGR